MYEIQCVCNTTEIYSTLVVASMFPRMIWEETANAYWIPMPDKHKRDPPVYASSPIVRLAS